MTEPARFGKYSKTIRHQQECFRALEAVANRFLAEQQAEIERLRGTLEEIATYTSDPVAMNAAREALAPAPPSPIGGEQP